MFIYFTRKFFFYAKDFMLRRHLREVLLQLILAYFPFLNSFRRLENLSVRPELFSVVQQRATDFIARNQILKARFTLISRFIVFF